MSPSTLQLASAGSARRLISVVDSHTCGQPTRVICEGVPAFGYGSLAEARDVLRAEHDWLRRYAVFEPRGHPSLFAAALLPAVDPGCATGVVFMDAAGYPDMCGHATIGVVTTLIDLGRVVDSTGETEVAIETPGGRIETRVTIAGSRAASVSFVESARLLPRGVRGQRTRGPARRLGRLRRPVVCVHRRAQPGARGRAATHRRACRRCRRAATADRRLGQPPRSAQRKVALGRERHVVRRPGRRRR